LSDENQDDTCGQTHRQTDMLSLQCVFRDWKTHIKIARRVMEM